MNYIQFLEAIGLMAMRVAEGRQMDHVVKTAREKVNITDMTPFVLL